MDDDRGSQLAPVLQESDLFMDALAASASAKKEPKKRKRRISTSKETNSPPTSPSTSTALTNGAAPNTSPMALRGITPPNFYQDTLESTEDTDGDKKPKEENADQSSDEMSAENQPPTPTEDEIKMDIDEKPLNESGLKGVLVHVKKKGPKKSLSWKAEAELVEVQYFELDETERVNVSKPFGDMARMEITSEKHIMQMRRIPIDDNMGAQMPWRMLMEIDLKIPLVEPGSKSLEKDIQFAREKSFIGMSPLMHRYAESPAEPDMQQYQVTDPVIIPLEDPENSDPDAPAQLWPEPKGSPPQVPVPNMPAMFPNIQAPFQNFPGPPPPSFQNVPFNPQNFVPPNMMGAGPPNVGPPGNPPDWNNMNPMNNVNMNNMNMNNGPPMMPPNCPPPEMMNQGPPMYPPNNPDNFNHNMNEFPPFNQPNMFPQNNFNMRGGRGGFRRGGGNGPWVRMNGPGPGHGGHGWNQRGAGGISRGGRMCKNVKMHGFCRNRDHCPFFHPN